jgi:hypothetical protein
MIRRGRREVIEYADDANVGGWVGELFGGEIAEDGYLVLLGFVVS